MPSLVSSKKSLSVFILLLVIYLASHLAGLVKLPVFADEAIYIRWAQLIIDDAERYLFFPLNDGKTPLFIWQLVPFLNIFSDPLYGARVLSVLGGLIQIVATGILIKELKGNAVAQFSAAIMIIFLPFWFLHHRMALMDGWMTVWLTLSLVFLLRALRTQKMSEALCSGLCLGASLLTKIPAILALPGLLLLSYSMVDIKKKGWSFMKYVVVSLVTGLGVFASLILAPAFSQLFTRGGDFLYSVSDIFEGIWLTTIPNTPSYVSYYWTYATPFICMLFIVSLFVKKIRKTSLALWLSFLSFYLPIALMGVIVFPRYLFPSMLFVTVASALTVGQLFEHSRSRIKWLGVGVLGLAVAYSLPFMYYLSVHPNKTPFVSSDVMQYLTEWSAGHGTKEVYQRLMIESESQTIAVATEGFFGTLPDGLLMYLHNQEVKNLAVQGVGQPITNIPDFLIDRKDSYDRLWLVVNSHRRQVDLPSNALLATYCRPYDAPCLELWDVTEVVHKLPSRE